MKLCILIGFNYDSTLKSSSIDMYLVYDFFNKRGFQSAVMSDIKKHPDNVIKGTLSDKIEDQIHSFGPEVHIDRHPLPNLKWFPVSDYNSFIDNLYKISFEDIRCLVLYYTGHCERGSRILLPDNNVISARLLLEEITKRCNSSTEILSIFDCCNASNLSLPYILKGDTFISDRTGELINANIICLASSNDNQPARSSGDRSYFTKYLIRELNKNTINMCTLRHNVQILIDRRSNMKKQTVNIYSSFNRYPVLYSWVLPSGIIINIKNCVIEIGEKEKEKEKK